VSSTFWLTGIPSAGKSTIAHAFAERMKNSHRVEVLDGDTIRGDFFPELGFGKEDRLENIRRIGELAVLLARNGVLSVVAVIAPYRSAREAVRRRHEEVGLRFVEVFVDADLTTCMRRDVKGLYSRARSGEISGLTGFDDPYEPPTDPEIRLRTDSVPLGVCVDRLVTFSGQGW
jgi:adenylylsulfate kinase